ncbi:MAG TPA: hypothetical protein VH369_22340 [Bryobacteraceae bacterium]
MLIWERFTQGPLCDIFGVGGAAGGIAQGAGTAAAGVAQATAAKYASDQQRKAAEQALNLQSSMFGTEQANIAPWLAAGKGALSQLSAGTQPGGQFAQQKYPTFQPTGMAGEALQPTPFQAPTAEQAAATPGYQFAFDQGLQALQRSQAATGITGGAAAKAAQQYGQNLASTNYQQAYGNALNTYGANQAAAQRALTGQLGSYETNFNTQNLLQNQAYNRLAGLAGVGQTAVNQLGSAAQNYGSQAGNLLTSAGSAAAAGTLGIGSGIGTLAQIPTAIQMGNALSSYNQAQQAANLAAQTPGLNAGLQSAYMSGFPDASSYLTY